MSLPQWAAVPFLAVAGVGLTMAMLLVLRHRLPSWLGSAHGLAGLAALCLLFGLNLYGGAATTASAWWALGILLGALFGGLLLFRIVFKNRAPLPLVALHGALAIAGILLLLRSAA